MRLKTLAHTSWPAATDCISDCITSFPELSWSMQVCHQRPSLHGSASPLVTPSGSMQAPKKMKILFWRSSQSPGSAVAADIGKISVK